MNQTAPTTKRICRFGYSPIGQERLITFYDFEALKVRAGKVVLTSGGIDYALPDSISEMDNIVISGGNDYTAREQLTRWLNRKWSASKRRALKLFGIDNSLKSDPLHKHKS